MLGNGNRTLWNDANFEVARRDMVARQLRDRGVHSPDVLSAMQTVPRHLFVPPERIHEGYIDAALAAGEGQTISQPYVVAAIAEALSLRGRELVLEVGAGTGYQAAVLSLLARHVISVESIPALAAAARERLERLGYPNVRIEEGDGSQGIPDAAPFDAILVSAAAPAIPQPLIDQLAEGGRLVIPVGNAEHQQLLRITKERGRTTERQLFDCRFVPLVGRYGWR
jgi:protein-L-isoaspartate(D-aspartate) O-methyltransferase